MASSSSSSEEGFELIRLNVVEDCYENPPAGFKPFDVECIPIQDLNPGDILPGGRTVLVTPYVKNISVCSGQYAQFQVLNGLGGQIDKALYLGSSAGRVADSQRAHEVEVPVDCTDTMAGPTEENGGADGDKGIAIRDHGRWYVVKLAQEASTTTQLQVEVYGGNKNPYSGSTMDDYKVAPYRPLIFPRYKEVGSLEEHGLTDEWYGLDSLPDDFEWGDEFSAVDDHTLPYGLGWARLARGVTIDQYSWDAADYEKHYTSDDDPDNSPSLDVAFVSPDVADDQIIVCFTEAIPQFSDGTGDQAIDSLTVETTGSTALNITQITLSGRPADNTFVIQLDRDVEYDDEVLTLTIGGGYVLDGDSNESTAVNATVQYKLEKFSLIPVVNLSDQPLVRGQTAFVSGQTREYTIDDQTRAWYEMYVDGERPQFTAQVIGGNVLNSAVTSFPNAIVQAESMPTVDSWDDYELDFSAVPVGEDPQPDDLPASDDGLGFVLGLSSTELFGEASTLEGKVEIVVNNFVGKFVLQADVVLMFSPRMVADNPSAEEDVQYRVVWEIFG